MVLFSYLLWDISDMLVYRLKGKGDGRHPCGEPVEEHSWLESTPFTPLCVLPVKRSQIQPTTLKSRLNCSKNRPARMWGWIVLKADEKSTKKESSMRPTSLEVFQKWVEQSDSGILYTPMWPVGKLHGIKYMLSFSYDLWPYQSLDIFHYYWCKSHWSKIIEGFWTTRFGDGDYHSILPDFRDMLCHILSGHVLLLTFVEWKTFKMSFCDSWKCCLSLSLKPSFWTSLHTSPSDECWLAVINSRQS